MKGSMVSSNLTSDSCLAVICWNVLLNERALLTFEYTPHISKAHLHPPVGQQLFIFPHCVYYSLIYHYREAFYFRIRSLTLDLVVVIFCTP